MVGTARLAPPSYTMALPSSFHPPVRQLNRNIVIGGSVVLFHVAALWALQSGLLRRAVEIVVPVAILSDIVAPPAPKVEQPPEPAKPAPPPPAKQPVAKKVERPQVPAPQPVAVPTPVPAREAPTGVEVQTRPAPPVTAAVEPAPAPSAAADKVELPFIDADYASNDDVFRPPGVSSRLGEYGTVVLRVTVGVNGRATQVQLAKSSGYPRLDNAAIQGARRLRFKPAIRNGVPVEFSYDFPVKYEP